MYQNMEIEHGIPVSRNKVDRVRGKWGVKEYPFDQMEVGDSFRVYPDADLGETLIVCQNLASGAASTYGKKTGKKFTTRQIDYTFVRVWRIE